MTGARQKRRARKLIEPSRVFLEYRVEEFLRIVHLFQKFHGRFKDLVHVRPVQFNAGQINVRMFGRGLFGSAICSGGFRNQIQAGSDGA